MTNLYNRRIAGWHLAESLETDLVIRAARKAIDALDLLGNGECLFEIDASRRPWSSIRCSTTASRNPGNHVGAAAAGRC